MYKYSLAAALAAFAGSAFAQSSSQEAPMNQAPAAPALAAPLKSTAAAGRSLPANTIVVVTPLQEISSKHIEEGQKVSFAVVNDVVENGVVAISRGSNVTGEITWKTGRAVGGKSGKFKVEFKSVSVGGREVAMRGEHRQEGRGNSVGALLGSMVISGRSAVMTPGQLVNAFTAEPLTY